MRADPVRRLRLVTLWTEVGGGGSQRVVGAALCGARLRMSGVLGRDFFSLGLGAPPAWDRPRLESSRTRRYSGSSRSADTARGTRRGRAASSATPDRTAR